MINKTSTSLLLLLYALLTAGCAEILFGIGGFASSVIGIYQRHQDKETQENQMREIKNLREAIEQYQEEVRKLMEGRD